MQEIKSLTSLRGIAAMAVVLQHFSVTAQLMCETTIPSLVPHGYMAVDFFFVLSGYIMCYTYLQTFQRQGWQAYKPFLQKRAIRLLPLQAFVVSSVLLLGWATTRWTGHNMFYAADRTGADVLANYFMLQGIIGGTNINGPSWSVSVEFLAYFSFPLLIYGVFSSRRWGTGVTAAIALGSLLALALTKSRLGLAIEGPPGGLVRCVTEFTLGMLSFRALQHQGFAAWIGRDRITAGVLLLCPLLALIRLDLLTALSFPLVVAAAASNRGRATAWLSHPALHLLGAVSYSLYLIHYLFCIALPWPLRLIHPAPLTAPQALLAAFVGSLIVLPFAWLTYRGIELPARAWLLRRLQARQVTRAAAV